jgi:hypothetical protein
LVQEPLEVVSVRPTIGLPLIVGAPVVTGDSVTVVPGLAGAVVVGVVVPSVVVVPPGALVPNTWVPPPKVLVELTRARPLT